MSDMPENPDLAFIGRSLARLLNEVASLRDDINVLAAIVRRMDNNQRGMLDELSAIHAQHSRFGNRLRAPEEKSGA